MNDTRNVVWFEIVSFLVDCLRSTRGDDLRRTIHVVEAVGPFAGPVVAPLTTIAYDPQLMSVWEDVADALGAIGKSACADTVTALKELLCKEPCPADPSFEYEAWGFQRAAAAALAQINSSESMSALAQGERRATDELRLWIRAVARQRTRTCGKLLPGFRSSWNLSERFRGTGRFSDIADGLAEIMRSSRFDDRIRAVMCLEAIGPDAVACERGLLALYGELPQEVRLTGLFAAIRSGPTSCRRHAARGLSRIFGMPGRKVPKLVDGLEPEMQVLPCRAAKTLGQTGWRLDEAVPVLIDALADKERTVCWLASQTLLQIGRPKEAEAALEVFWRNAQRGE